MSSSNKAVPALDLEVLERELATASATRRPPAEDPLAELARIVAQDPPPAARKAEGRPSFDDFLNGPPQPVMGKLPRTTPVIEPLFPDGMGAEAPKPGPTVPLDPLEALLAQDLGLRSGLDEMPGLPKAFSPDVNALDAAPVASPQAEAAEDNTDEAPQQAGTMAADNHLVPATFAMAPEAHMLEGTQVDTGPAAAQPQIVSSPVEPRATDDLVSEQPEAVLLQGALEDGTVGNYRMEMLEDPHLPVRDVALESPTELSRAQPSGIDLMALEQALESSLIATSDASQAVSGASGAGIAGSSSPQPPARFDDMVAEFEAAMRDVEPTRSPAMPTSLEPSVVPPPPAKTMSYMPTENGRPQRASDGSDGSFGAGGLAAGAIAAGAVGAGTLAAGSLAAASATSRAKPRRGFLLAGGTIAVAIVGLGGLFLFGSGSGARSPAGSATPPVIAAKPGATKERPANPGGVEVPNQDKEILQSRPQPQQAERVAPREEQPVDLAQAQRQASAATAPVPPVPANGAPVRQIPGIAVVAPVTTTPPPAAAPTVVPAEPAPRPVASVPITIAGQPPVAIAAPPIAATPPQAAATPALTPPAATPPVSTPPVTPPAAAAPPAEPRRVRAVPIRPENGEAAPTRAQGQPRVVPPAPRAADPSPENAPLRILPAESRQAAAAPAAPSGLPVQPGTVPSSRPTQDVTPDAATPTRTASTGSGFTVQLAAEGSEEAARARFNRMRSQYGAVLGGEQANIRSAEVNGRSVYRIRVGNMSRESAVDMCERLKASGGSCFVARN